MENSSPPAPSAQNPPSIRQMFGDIAKKYDLANSVLSFGIHTLWKKKLVKYSQASPGSDILDCATGTGDLAFLFFRHLKGNVNIIGSDFCEPMLEIAKAKASQFHLPIQFEFADVTDLSYPDSSFDLATISFGIRNVNHPVRALSELARVVKPKGKVLILEFGQPKGRIFSKLYQTYSTWLLPKIGGILTGEIKAYQYLQTSSAKFPCGDSFIQMALEAHPFAQTLQIPLFFGIAYLYVLQKEPID